VEERKIEKTPQNAEIRTITRYINQLTEESRAFVLDFVKWLKDRESPPR